MGINGTFANETYGYDDAYQEEEELDDYYSNKWLLILPRVAGVISLFGILCVALEAWKDLRQVRDGCTRTTTAKNVSTITHIQFFYQIPLFCHAMGFALGTTTAPSGQAWGAVGNTATCSFSGFLMQFAPMVPSAGTLSCPPPTFSWCGTIAAKCSSRATRSTTT